MSIKLAAALGGLAVAAVAPAAQAQVAPPYGYYPPAYACGWDDGYCADAYDDPYAYAYAYPYPYPYAGWGYGFYPAYGWGGYGYGGYPGRGYGYAPGRGAPGWSGRGVGPRAGGGRSGAPSSHGARR